MEKGVQILELAIILPLLILLSLGGVELGISFANRKADRDQIEQSLIEFRDLAENSANFEDINSKTTIVLESLASKLSLSHPTIKIMIGKIKDNNEVETLYQKQLSQSNFEVTEASLDEVLNSKLSGIDKKGEFVGIVFIGKEKGLGINEGSLFNDATVVPINRIRGLI